MRVEVIEHWDSVTKRVE
jgi:hypothetical protein